jgi:hypothetical protein
MPKYCHPLIVFIVSLMVSGVRTFRSRSAYSAIKQGRNH